MLPHKNLYMSIHSHIIHDSPKVETTHMFINWWMDKQNVIYPYSAILFSHKNVWGTNTYYNMHGPYKHYAKWKKQNTKVSEC